MNWKIGVTQWSLPCTVPDCIEAAGALGLQAIQLDLGAAEEGYPLTGEALQARLLSDARKYGVEIVSIVLNDLCKNGFIHAEGDPHRETAWETMRLGVETAARMGVRSVCLPSFFDNEIRDAAGYARTVEAMRYICALGAAQGVTIYTENVMDAAHLAAFFRDVGCEDLHLLFDSQNYSFMAGLDAAEIFTAAAARVGDFLHVKDGRDSLGSAPLGTGTSGFTNTLRAITAAGFCGYYILENKYETMACAAEEIAVLRDMLQKAAAQA